MLIRGQRRTEAIREARFCQSARLASRSRNMSTVPAAGPPASDVGGDALVGVDNCGVVAAEAAADLGEADVGQLAREVHGDLAGEGDLGAAVAGEQAVAGEAEGLGGGVLDRSSEAARGGSEDGRGQPAEHARGRRRR